jgi:hypothetical protein
MSCEASEGGETPDGKFAARDDTRWVKHGYSGDAEFIGEYANMLLSQWDDHPVVPKVEIHPVMKQNEVSISMALNARDDESDLHAGIAATFTADQIFALADALEETAGAARDGELAESLTHE